MVNAHWLIGREIVEVEQAGSTRAAYGEEVLDRLSATRKAVLSEFTPRFPLSLGWPHYLILMKVAIPAARVFYEIEAARQVWSTRSPIFVSVKDTSFGGRICPFFRDPQA